MHFVDTYLVYFANIICIVSVNFFLTKFCFDESLEPMLKLFSSHSCNHYNIVLI